ncbi:rhamnogalacturonan acetylesterase [Sinomicrobium sp. M5D2P9]
MYKLRFYHIALCLLACIPVLQSQPHADSLQGEPLIFTFGQNAGAEGQGIATPLLFKEDSFGFDFKTAKKVSMQQGGFVAEESVYFSVSLPEGNYKVTVELGSDDSPSDNTVKAESGRIMLAEEILEAGQVKTESFVVNLRSVQIREGEEVVLKDREKSELNWDEKLTLEFSKGTAVRKLAITPVSDITTLFLAGDSTVTDQDLSPWASWGQFVTQYLNEDIVVANYASSGASLSSFKARKRFEKILSLIQKGDYLIIEFGHNDEKQKGEGEGAWQNYTDLLIEFATKAREKGALPILATPTQRRHFTSEGKLKDTHGDYPGAMRKVAEEYDVPLIDLTAMTTVLYETWGDEKSRMAFVHYPARTFPGQDKELADNTHFNDFGAHEIALCVLSAVQSQHTGLERYIRTPPDYSPSHPNDFSDWTLPMSPRFEPEKPDGN